LNPRDRDSLVTELRNELEGTAERLNIPSKSRDLAVFKVGTRFEARDVRLVHLGLRCNIDLGLADGVPQSSQGEVNASRSAKSAAQDTDWFDFGFWTMLS
jgi:hypothetical protein